MVEKQIPIEKLKPDFPCPACKKIFDDCVCTEDTADTGISEMISAGLILWLTVLVILWFVSKL